MVNLIWYVTTSFMFLLKQLVEYVFPTRPDYVLVKDLEVGQLQSLLYPTTYPDFTALLLFGEPLVRACIHEAKFQKNEKAWKLLGQILAVYFKHCSANTIILPIPLSLKRHKKRGYNQVAKIVQQALKHSPQIEVNNKVLYRKFDTKPQTTLKRIERLTNVANAFGVRDPADLVGKNIIIIDDVATTGATLLEAQKSLEQCGIKNITLLALAH